MRRLALFVVPLAALVVYMVPKLCRSARAEF